MNDFRCPNKLVGRAADDFTLEVKCDSRWCGASKTTVVMHYFDTRTGSLVDTKLYKEPQTLFTTGKGE